MVVFVMWFSYVLRSKKNFRLYTGFTNDINRRFKEHNSKNGGKYSLKNAPFELVFFEAFKDKRDATKAEIFWKSGYGREVLKDKIKYSLER
jgi:putative endonuclease